MRNPFHAALAAVILTFVLVGFAPSFFLRPAFTERALPGYLYLHGIVLTAWFVIALVQPVLIATRRTSTHRRLGVAGAAVAAALVPLSVVVAVRAIPRYRASGVAPAEIQFIVIGDLIALGVFSILVGTAIARRRSPDWHRRFMAVASIMIVGPAIARLERVVGFAVPVPAVVLALLLSLAVHDAVRMRRVHRATMVSVGLAVVALGGLRALVGTAAAAAVIEWLAPGA